MTSHLWTVFFIAFACASMAVLIGIFKKNRWQVLLGLTSFAFLGAGLLQRM